MKFKVLSRFFIAGALVWGQACASSSIAKFFDKPYFEYPSAQLARADKDLFEKALSRQIYNRIPEAIKAWNQFIEEHPGSFEAQNNLGLVYFEDDQVDQSIIAFEKALALEPNDAKIKTNLAKALKFKAALLKEGKDYASAIDSLLRAQDVSTGYQKERIGYVIERYEDQVFEQAKRANTMLAYEGFLKRFPNSEKNADEARMKIKGMQPVSAEMMEFDEEPEMDEVWGSDFGTASSMVKSKSGEMKKAGSTMEFDEEPGIDEEVVWESDSGTASSMVKSESGEMKKAGPMMERGGSMMKDASRQMRETAERFAEENPVGGSQVLKQPREITRGMERQVEIATQPHPKPSSAPDLFPVPASGVSGSNFDEFDRNVSSAKRMVEITTFNGSLRVRKMPSVNSKVLTTMERGAQAPFIKEKDGWYYIEFSQGRMGWVTKKYSRLME